MKRWFYIMLGGLGVGLALASMFMLWMSPQLPPPYPLPVAICEYVSIAVGLGLACLGLINGRQAGEFDIGAYKRASRKRDHHVSGQEIEFACPVCHKTYRASPLLAGKAFVCRDCREVFNVPVATNPPSEHERRMLPSSA